MNEHFNEIKRELGKLVEEIEKEKENMVEKEDLDDTEYVSNELLKMVIKLTSLQNLAEAIFDN